MLRAQRDTIVKLIPAGSTVLDVGSGTGELGLLLRRVKGCQVVGVDLSLRMVSFAQRRNPHDDDVVFLHRDAGNLAEFEDGHFDYGVLCQVLHELPRERELRVLAEAVRLARTVVLVDFKSPQPQNAYGFVAGVIEATIGRDHHRAFEGYLAAGGLMGIVGEAGLDSRVAQEFVFSHGGSEAVVLAGLS
jgi:ubiquinone/menaquinone biosynthesis C-methylase UbiE